MQQGRTKLQTLNSKPQTLNRQPQMRLLRVQRDQDREQVERLAEREKGREAALEELRKEVKDWLRVQGLGLGEAAMDELRKEGGGHHSPEPTMAQYSHIW